MAKGDWMRLLHLDIAVPACFCLLLAASPLHAQAPPDPPSPWATQTASVGMALTQGNKDALSVNLGYEVIYDPKSRNRVKSDGVFLYGRTDGATSTNRLGMNARDEYQIAGRAYTYGQVQYLRDVYKNIVYLVAPTAGFGYRAIDTDDTKLSFDAGLGGVFENGPPGASVLATSGGLSFGDKLSHKISPTTTLTQNFTGLYRTTDLTDALYSFGAAVTASVSAHSQLKVEVLDVYKNLAPVPFRRNDLAVLVGLVFKR